MFLGRHKKNNGWRYFSRVISASTKKQLITSGLGWGRLPSHEVTRAVKSGQLIQLDNIQAMEVPVYLANLKNKPLGPVGIKVWEFFNQQSTD